MLRVYVRTCMVKAFGWDDIFMVLALFAHIMFAVSAALEFRHGCTLTLHHLQTCAIGGIHWGTGRHMSDLTGEQQYKAMRYWWLCYIVRIPRLLLSKGFVLK